jgi:hypothetical protein
VARIANWVCSTDAPLAAERITPSQVAKRSRGARECDKQIFLDVLYRSKSCRYVRAALSSPSVSLGCCGHKIDGTSRRNDSNDRSLPAFELRV